MDTQTHTDTNARRGLNEALFLCQLLEIMILQNLHEFGL